MHIFSKVMVYVKKRLNSPKLNLIQQQKKCVHKSDIAAFDVLNVNFMRPIISLLLPHSVWRKSVLLCVPRVSITKGKHPSLEMCALSEGD